jgi:WD40 repeat protein
VFSPDGKSLTAAVRYIGIKSPTLVSTEMRGDPKGDVKIWDAATGQVTTTLSGHSATAWAVAFRPSGRLLATSSADRTIRLWDLASGRTVGSIEAKSAALDLAFSPDSSILAATSYNSHDVKLWSIP